MSEEQKEEPRKPRIFYYTMRLFSAESGHRLPNGGIVLAIEICNDYSARVAFAICSLKDIFVFGVGKRLARERLLSNDPEKVLVIRLAPPISMPFFEAMHLYLRGGEAQNKTMLHGLLDSIARQAIAILLKRGHLAPLDPYRKVRKKEGVHLKALGMSPEEACLVSFTLPRLQLLPEYK